MGLENSHPVTVNKQHLFEVDHRDFGLKPVRYLAVVNNKHLTAGESYRIFINPWHPGVALLTRDNGAAVGLVEQWETVSVMDTHAQKRMAGKQAHWEAERNQAMERRHEVEAAELAHMREHNAAVLAAATGVTPETRAVERRLDREAARQGKDFRDLESTTESTEIAEKDGGVTMEELNKL
jgi:hypothetical protein